MAEENKIVLEDKNKLQKEYNRVYGLKMGTLMFSAITVSILGLGGLMSFVGNITTDVLMSDIKSIVGQDELYLGDVASKREKLVEAFSSGAIGYEEYKAACDYLLSGENIVQFMQNSQDKQLNECAQRYIKNKDFADTVTKKGLPTYGAIAGVGFAGATVAEIIDRKYKRKLQEHGIDPYELVK